MELTKLNSMNNLNYVSDNKDSQKAKALISSKEVENKYSSNDKVDVNLQNSSKSNFVNNVTSSINKLASLQKTQSNISNQLEITTDIVKTTSVAVNSPEIKLDDKQPEVKNLLDSYNDLSKNSASTEGFDENGIFFDGVLGSKPLSASEILQAVESQQSKLKFAQEKIGAEIESVISDTKQSFEVEKAKVETKVEFKNFDFEQESAQFNSSTLGNIRDGIIPSQANATSSNSVKLLA